VENIGIAQEAWESSGEEGGDLRNPLVRAPPRSNGCLARDGKGSQLGRRGFRNSLIPTTQLSGKKESDDPGGSEVKKENGSAQPLLLVENFAAREPKRWSGGLQRKRRIFACLHKRRHNRVLGRRKGSLRRDWGGWGVWWFLGGRS